MSLGTANDPGQKKIFFLLFDVWWKVGGHRQSKWTGREGKAGEREGLRENNVAIDIVLTDASLRGRRKRCSAWIKLGRKWRKENGEDWCSRHSILFIDAWSKSRRKLKTRWARVEKGREVWRTLQLGNHLQALSLILFYNSCVLFFSEEKWTPQAYFPTCSLLCFPYPEIHAVVFQRFEFAPEICIL